MGQQGPPRQGSSYFTYSSAEQILWHTASKAKTWKGTPPLLRTQDYLICLLIPHPQDIYCGPSCLHTYKPADSLKHE